MKFVIWVVGHAVAVGAAVWLLAGITLTGATTGKQLTTLLIVGLIFGIVSAIVKPIVMFFSIPFIILTLGLFMLVVNALMLLLTSKIAGSFGLGFHVNGFWTAIFGGVIVAIMSMIIESLMPDRQRR